MKNISIFQAKIESQQRAICIEQQVEYVPAQAALKSGFALSTKGLQPMNGLRHPPTGDTTGWYIWCGEHFSESPGFFAPLHTSHIYEEYPELTKLLGLPPGYRFLIADAYLDIWYDASLLNV
ncbi:MAG TPA: hypothetical protein VKZ53_19185 [Candidatus Angelobacter sp.]|nr:hypothetical protein [Candidatus Angelobacter sp.]